MDREKALDLAKKLAKFSAENGATQNEIELAATRLQKLMNDHNLSKLDLHEEESSSKVGEEAARHEWARPPYWLKVFVGDISKCFRVRVVYFLDKQEIHFIGEETNVALAKYFCACVLELPRYSWQEAAKKQYIKDHGLTEAPRGFKQSFYLGMCAAIIKRLRDEYDSWFAQLDKEKQSGMRSLIVVEQNAVKQYMETRYPSLGTMRSSRPKHNVDEAASRGYAKGMAAQLNKGVGRTERPGHRIA